jgi:hypothetical protein
VNGAGRSTLRSWGTSLKQLETPRRWRGRGDDNAEEEGDDEADDNDVDDDNCVDAI